MDDIIKSRLQALNLTDAQLEAILATMTPCGCVQLSEEEDKMMDDNIKSRLQALSWYNPADIQFKAIGAIAEDDTFDPSLLLQDHLRKDCWENASIILAKWGSPRIDAIIPGLFLWLRDPTWPGAMEIQVLLFDLPTEKTEKALQDAIAEAKRTKDEEWLYNLEDFASRGEYELGVREYTKKVRAMIAEYFGGIYP